MDIEETASRPITVTEAAEFLGYKKSYVYRLIHEKRIAYYKPGGSRGAHVYFKKSELEAFIYRGRCAADFELSEQADELLFNSKTKKRKYRSTVSQKEKV